MPSTEYAAYRAHPLPADGPATVVNAGAPAAVLQPVPPGDLSHVAARLFPADPQSPPDADGCQLGHFTIAERIGAGGMGAVFRAVDERLGRDVAVKVLSPAQSREAASVERFRNEARAAAQLDHDNIARVFFIGEDHGLNFIAFEYVKGTNLRELIRRSGRLHPAEAVNYTLQIAMALGHTSEHGVVHRDIKPSNVIIAPTGRAKLVDLGLARKQTSDLSRDLTVAGTTLGTFDYISPEQARDPRNVDVRSDIYSLGCTLYQMLTGEPPYPEGTVLQKLLDHQGAEPPDPATRNRRVSPELSAVVRKMMASNPAKRHATPEALIRDLMHLAGGLGLKGVHPDGLVWTNEKLERRSLAQRNLVWLFAAAVVVLGAILIERLPLATSPAPVQTSQYGLPDKGRAIGNAGKTGQSSSPEQPKNGTVGRPDQNLRTRPTKEPQIEVDPLRAGAGVLALSLDAIDERLPQAASFGAIALSALTSRPAAAATTVESVRPAVSIVGSDVAYRTLESACIAAKDGDVVLLAFNGQRTGRDGKPVINLPFRVSNKKITLRAAEGFRPLVVFAAEQIPFEPARTRMIRVSAASLDVINVDFAFDVDASLELADRRGLWTLLSLTGAGAERVRLIGVGVRIANPDELPTAVVEIAAISAAEMMKMKSTMPGASSEPPDVRFEVVVKNGFIRGGADLFATWNARTGRCEVTNGIVALDGALLAASVDRSSRGVIPGDRVDLKLEHATCLLGEGLVTTAGAAQSQPPVPVHVAAFNNVIATSSTRPMISMSGGASADDFRRKLLRWEGASNYYNGFERFWTIAAGDVVRETDALDFDQWKRHWGTAVEVDAHLGGVIFKSRWAEKSAVELTIDDVLIDDKAADNPAATGASNGKAVGVNPLTLPMYDSFDARATTSE